MRWYHVRSRDCQAGPLTARVSSSISGARGRAARACPLVKCALSRLADFPPGAALESAAVPSSLSDSESTVVFSREGLGLPLACAPGSSLHSASSSEEEPEPGFVLAADCSESSLAAAAEAAYLPCFSLARDRARSRAAPNLSECRRWDDTAASSLPLKWMQDEYRAMRWAHVVPAATDTAYLGGR